MIILLFYIVEVYKVSLILFYIQISFGYIQITGHRDPYYLSIITSCLAPNNIEITACDNFNCPLNLTEFTGPHMIIVTKYKTPGNVLTTYRSIVI